MDLLDPVPLSGTDLLSQVLFLLEVQQRCLFGEGDLCVLHHACVVQWDWLWDIPQACELSNAIGRRRDHARDQIQRQSKPILIVNNSPRNSLQHLTDTLYTVSDYHERDQMALPIIEDECNEASKAIIR